MPTLLDMAGVSVPRWSQGRSIKDLLAGHASGGRQAIFAEIRRGDTSYILGCRTQEHLFSWEVDLATFADDGELYDLRTDPLQVRNLFCDPEYADLVRKFRNRVALWLATDE